MTWQVVYQNGCERGFYDQDGTGELTVPNGTHVIWVQGDSPGVFPRPEMDFKDAEIQPEVFQGRFSASGSYRHAQGRYYLVSEKIFVDPSHLVRASCAYMHVFDGGGGGARIGIVNGDGAWAAPGPITDDVGTADWGAWEGTYGDSPLPNREWVALKSPAIEPREGYVRMVMQFNADHATPSSAGHWDVFTLEQDLPESGAAIDYDRIGQIFRDVLAEWDRR